MKQILLLTTICTLSLAQTKAQNVSIGIPVPEASAKLHIEDANRGLLIPRVSLVATNNSTTPVNTPVTGLLVWNTNAAVTGGSGAGFYYWNGSLWIRLSDTDTQNTLDQAYDEGGAGLGRIIDATDGAVRINGEDGFLVTGTLGAGDVIEATGAGVRMFFNPRTAAFRAGGVAANEWDPANVGDYSVAFGYDNIASDVAAAAFGGLSQATAPQAFAAGYDARATGNSAVALGGYSRATSFSAFAAGYDAQATQNSAVAMGGFTRATAVSAFAMGYQTEATQHSAFATGYQTFANGQESFTAGRGNTAPSRGETVFGAYSTTYTPAGSATNWNNNDRLFTIGNGTSAGARSNALIIYKNGRMNINDAYTMPNTDGTNGQVLTTDGVGTVSWTTASGAGDVDFYEVGTTTAPNNIADNMFTNGHLAISTADPGTHTLMVAEATTPAIKLGHTGGFNAVEAGRLIFDEYADNYTTVGTYCGMEFYYDGAIGVDLLHLNAGCTAVTPMVTFARNSFQTGFRTTAPTADLSVNGTANKPGGGAWAVFSDARLKKNVSAYTEGLELIKKVRPVNFTYNDKLKEIWGENKNIEGKVYQGVIAQELQAIAPDMVNEVSLDHTGTEADHDYDPNMVKNTATYLEVDPNKFTYALINAVQEQQKMIEAQNQKIEALQKQVRALQK